jgi:hypothetical protein
MTERVIDTSVSQRAAPVMPPRVKYRPPRIRGTSYRLPLRRQSGR